MSKRLLSLLILCTLVLGSAIVGTSPRARAADKKAAAAFEVYKDKAGEYRWRLRATNTQVLAISSDGYNEKRSCLSAIESVKRDVADAPVQEVDAAK